MTKKKKNRGAQEPTDTTPAEKRKRFREQHSLAKADELLRAELAELMPSRAELMLAKADA